MPGLTLLERYNTERLLFTGCMHYSNTAVGTRIIGLKADIICSCVYILVLYLGYSNVGG